MMIDRDRCLVPYVYMPGLAALFLRVNYSIFAILVVFTHQFKMLSFPFVYL